MKSEKVKNKLNVLYIIPRYRTYGMGEHYVMPMGGYCMCRSMLKEVV